MKFLICGLGSIGKRTAENLEKMGYQHEDIGFFRTSKGTKSFGDEFLTGHDEKHPVFVDLDEALKQKPEAVFIMNPTSLHIPVAIKAAQAGSNLFITKPLSHNLEGVDELEQLVEENNLTAYVTYQFRFHYLLRQVKKWLDEKKIGRVVSVSAELSERIVDLHPWEKYQVSYIGREDLGGGPILSFSHEIDYLYWLFGMPKWIFAAGGRLGNLEIDTEDTVKTIMQFPETIVSLHLDYLKQPARRFLQITGTEGRIFCDFMDKKLEFIPLSGEKITINEPEDYERNQMHIDELNNFFESAKSGAKPFVDLKQGEDVLKICLAIKESMREQKIVNL